MTKLFLFWLAGIIIGAAISEEDKNIIWAEFSFISRLPQRLYPDIQQENYCAASIANLDKKSQFFARSGRGTRSTLAIAVNENEEGKTLAHSLIADASKYFNKSGFHSASTLLEYCLWVFLVQEIPEETQVSALYATISNKQIQIVNLGLLWAGIFRRGQIISMTSPFRFRSMNMLSPAEYLSDVGADGLFQTRRYMHNWAVEDDDILVITRADLPSRFLEVVQIAVQAALKENAPVSRIVSNLQNYYHDGQNQNKVFVAVRVRESGDGCKTMHNFWQCLCKF